jgi:hypothetical protein
VFFVVALLTLPAYLSGVGTEFTFESYPDISKETIVRHHDAALVASMFMLLTGVLSWLALWQWRRLDRPRNGALALVLLASAVTLVLMGRAANIGGEIRHPEILPPDTPAAVVAPGWLTAQAIRDLVFRPLNLEHAGTHSNDFIVQRFAAGHTTRNGTSTLQRPFGASASVTAGGGGFCITDLMTYPTFPTGAPAAVVSAFFDTFGSSRICTCAGMPLFSVDTQLQGLPYPSVGATTRSLMYSPPILKVWLPPHPVLRKLTEPLAWGRSMSRSSALAPPLTVFAPTSRMRGAVLLYASSPSE